MLITSQALLWNCVTMFILASGVWTVGNTGREQGCLWHCLIAAYIAYPIRYYVYDETYWMTIMLVISALTFESLSKQWRREPPKRHSAKKRIIRLSAAACIYLSLWGSFIFFNGKITDSEGDEIAFSEVISNFLTSPWWTDLKTTLHDTWQFAQHNGWYETWKQIVDSMDMDGEQNSYKVSLTHSNWTSFQIKSNRKSFLILFRFSEYFRQLHSPKLLQLGEHFPKKTIRTRLKMNLKNERPKSDSWKFNKHMRSWVK